MNDTLASASPVQTLAPEGCQFVFFDGRRCRMLRTREDSQFCPFHYREQRHLLALHQLGAELAPPSGEFKTATDIHHVLGRIFSLVARDKIVRRDAALLTWVAQLMLQSLPRVNDEMKRAFGYDVWAQSLKKAIVDAQPKLNTAE